MRKSRLFVAAAAMSLGVLIAPAAPAQGEPEVLAAIIAEGKDNSQVWDILEHISYNIGTRLTGSSRLEKANFWAAEQFEQWGLQNVHQHQWGEIPLRFDRGPSHVHLIDPRGRQATVLREFEFTTPSWTLGTDGPVQGRVVKLPDTVEEVLAMREALEGAWILTQTRPRGRRGVLPPGTAPEVVEEIDRILKEAGVMGTIVSNPDEIIRTFASQRWGGIESLTMEQVLEGGRTIHVRRSDYDAMNSRLADGEEVILEVNLDHAFTEGPIPLYNTVAEIPGTEWPDEVIIISAHLDSWDGPGSMGTQDNGTGSSTTMEAARILMAVGVQPKRTIRFILWTGEEQGLLGARAYVRELSETERAKISGCFVDDGGTNYHGGLVCIEPMAEMLARATEPINYAFPDKQVEIRIVPRMPRGGASDHAAFNAVGIPGFFWIEKGSGGREGKNYRFIHHTQHDTPRYAVPEYLVQSGTTSAVLAYNLAMADTLLPRESATDLAEAETEADERPAGRRGRPAEAEVVRVETDDTAEAEGDGAAGALSGVWAAQLAMGEGNGPRFSLYLEHEADGTLKGRTESPMGRGEITSGKYDVEANAITFTTQHEEYGEIRFNARIADDGRMVGTLSAGGDFVVDFTATRGTSG